jgi:hypothetical protein
MGNYLVQLLTLPGRKKIIFFTLLLAFLLLTVALGTMRVGASVPHLAYGFNVAEWDVDLLQSMGFNWIKVFGAPGDRLPVNVLLRIDANASHMGDLNAFGQQMLYLAQNNGAYIDAYEIGNEVNLDVSFGWAAPPVAQEYAVLLCVAYNQIKMADPTAIVVSAGLAPVGRVSGNWGGHPGHNGQYQDEREYLREFLAAGGGDCLDVLGYHPYGFSADYDAEPDVPSSDPTQNCANGFCFRGTEKIYDIMQANGLADKKIWATEYGWIVAPPDHCLGDPGWQGRIWQIVSEEKQASNLRGSFEYADAHWPWMGAMVVFNLNFNKPGLYPICEQMRYYAVEERPAEEALGDMPKNTATIGPSLRAYPESLHWLIDVDEQPLTHTLGLKLVNDGWHAFAFTVTADSTADLVPLLENGTGIVAPSSQALVLVTLTISRPLGDYSGTLTVVAEQGTQGAPLDIPLEARVVEEVHHLFLPLISNG